METKSLPTAYDYLAPDGSEIRLLPSVKGGGLAHCTLPGRTTSAAVAHKTVEEIWYFLTGNGEVWRREGASGDGTTVRVGPGVSLTIAPGTQFQFRNRGDGPLTFLIATMPPWPGPAEATAVANHWAPGKKEAADPTDEGYCEVCKGPCMGH